MQAQKKRTNNFSSDEKRILTELVLQYKDVIENKRTDATTNSAKLRGWMRLAEEFNTTSTYCHRTHTVLKGCWENIKRQTKKDRADHKKKLFMTGGGKPPSPPQCKESAEIVEVILGPALEGLDNIYDSNAGSAVIINDCPVERVEVIDDIEYSGTSENVNYTNIVAASTSSDIENKTTYENILSSTSTKDLLKEKDVSHTDNWCSWTPQNLKTPITKSLRVPKQSEDGWLKRRRPKSDSLGDELMKEKIKLVHILQENAEKESRVRLAILEEQLKQEQLKTQKLTNN